MRSLFTKQTQRPSLSKQSSLEYLKPKDQKSASSIHIQFRKTNNHPLQYLYHVNKRAHMSAILIHTRGKKELN